MKIKKLCKLVAVVIVASSVIVGAVQATTTLSTNIYTDGSLFVTGTSTLIGNVGIGTTTPAYKLDVNGSARFTSQIKGISLIHANGSVDFYTANADTDIARGTTLGLVLATSTVGDTVHIGPGTYTRTTDSFTIPAGVTVIGSGRHSTILTKTAYDGSVKGVIAAYASSTIESLYIKSQAPVVPLVSNDIAVEIVEAGNYYVRDIKLTADVDGFNPGFSGNLYIENSELYCKFDCIHGANMNIEIRNSKIIVTGLSAGNEGISRGASVGENMTLKIFDSNVEAYGGTTNTSAIGAGDGGTIEIYNSALKASNDSGSIYGINGEFGTITVSNSSIGVSGPGAIDIFNTGDSTITLNNTSGSGSAGEVTHVGDVTENLSSISVYNGKVGIGTSNPTSLFQVATSTSNATTSIEIGKPGQNKGSCLVMYDITGSVQYVSIAAGVFRISSTSCK